MYPVKSVQCFSKFCFNKRTYSHAISQVFEVAPSLHMVELRKTGGDTLEFHNVCYQTLYILSFHSGSLKKKIIS